jgi:hypothetical protein
MNRPTELTHAYAKEIWTTSQQNGSASHSTTSEGEDCCLQKMSHVSEEDKSNIIPNTLSLYHFQLLNQLNNQLLEKSRWADLFSRIKVSTTTQLIERTSNFHEDPLTPIPSFSFEPDSKKWRSAEHAKDFDAKFTSSNKGLKQKDTGWSQPGIDSYNE